MAEVKSHMRIYTDRKYLPENASIVPMLRPHWTDLSQQARLAAPVYSRYGQPDTLLSAIVSSIKDSDVVVLPSDWKRGYVFQEREDLAYALAEVANSAGKPFVVFFHGDDEWPVPIDNAIVFRHSLYKSTQDLQTYAMPSWNQDIVREYANDTLVLRNKQPKPVIGFCGKATWAPSHLFRFWMKKAVRTIQHQATEAFSSHPTTMRSRVLQQFIDDRRVETNFIIHSKYYGGSFQPKTQSHDPSKKAQVTEQYALNMINSDYIVCIRGNGNYSVRLYETLSAGRIPVFINTDCVLPYDFAINYRDYFVWVEESELDTLTDRVVEFHESLSNADFVELQRRCRRLYDEYLSPEGFFKYFHLHFATK